MQNDAKEEVRARLNIEDVIGEYVQLKRSGRNFKGLSPFSGEKTPSFVVSPEKHIWHDFSSGKGGDLFSFIMEVEGLDFRQALELLARRAGVDLTILETKGSREIKERKERALKASELAARYFMKCLVQNTHAQEYIFKKRGLNKQVVDDFRIGYAPDSRDGLMKALKAKGLTEKEIKDAGLMNQYGGDLFRGRMMVPLMDREGRVIGFTGRILMDDPKAPKYLNTPQTLLYDKSRHVFGLSQAKEFIRKSDCAVVVEGNLDVVSSHQAGIKHVVATAGTAMTEYHLGALSRLTENIKLAFDGDKAGLSATERAIPVAQGVGVKLTIITMPDDIKDPDELIQKDVALWQEAIEGSEPAVDWVIRQHAGRVDLDTEAGKTEFTTAVLKVIRELKDPVSKDHYIKFISKKANISEEALIEKMSVSTNPEKIMKQVRPESKVKAVEVQEQDKNMDALLAVAWIDKAIRRLLVNVEKEAFSGEPRQAVVGFLLDNLEDDLDIDAGTLPSSLQDYKEYVSIFIIPDKDMGVAWNSDNRIATANEQLKKIRLKYIEKMEAEAIKRGDNDEIYRLNGEKLALKRGEKHAR